MFWAILLTAGIYSAFQKSKSTFTTKEVSKNKEKKESVFHKKSVDKPRNFRIAPSIMWGAGILVLMVIMSMMQLDNYLKASVIDSQNATRVIQEARKYIGTPYVLAAQPVNVGNKLEPGYDANKNGPGFDCSSFIQVVFHNALGIDLPRISRDQAKVAPRVDISKVQPGDLLFFQIWGNDISHVSMVTGKEGDKLKVIHASNYPDENVKEEVLSGKYWEETFRFATKMPGTKQTVENPLQDDSAVASAISEELKANITQTEPTPEELEQNTVRSVKNVEFKDITASNNPFYDAIAYAASKNIINSGSSVDFRPKGTLSRAEAVKIISEALGFNPQPEIDNFFPDVKKSNHWVGKYLQKFRSRGIMNGYEDGSFGIDDFLTSEQLIKILYNAFNLPDTGGSYDDVPQDHWANKYTGPFARYNLFPDNGGTIGFGRPVTREITMEAVYRVLEYKNKL